MLFELDGELELQLLSFLLPITYVNVKSTKKNGKLTPPATNQAGCITTLIFDGKVRGFIRSEKRDWKHGICLDISTTGTNSYPSVNVKIMSEKITVVGCKGEDNGTESFNLILSHVKRIQRYIDFSERNPLTTDLTISWICNNIVEGGTKLKTNGKKLPKEISFLGKFLLNYLTDWSSISRYKMFLEIFRNTDSVYSVETGLSLAKSKVCMINYQFSLNSSDYISLRVPIRNLFRNIEEDIWAEYNRVTSRSATVRYAYDVPEDETEMRSGNLDPSTSFKINAGGSTTMSAMNPKHAKVCFERFFRTIEMYKEVIFRKR